MNRLGDLFRLLRPHAGPHSARSCGRVFGTASAMLQQGTFLLLEPTWEALFPEEEVRALLDVGGGRSGARDGRPRPAPWTRRSGSLR